MDDYFADTTLYLYDDSSVKATDTGVDFIDLLGTEPVVSVNYEDVPDLIHFLLSAYTNRE